MPGYLEGYGAGEEQRERKIRWIVLSLLGALLIGATLYFTFRDYPSERKLNQFLDALRRQDYKTAYSYWGCSVEVPCRDYPYDKFLEDWGPKGVNAKFSNSGLGDSERCGTGFMAALNSGNDEVSLWVERNTGVLSYAPWQQCPEKKLRLMKWLRMKFGRG
ncbi:MAG: hypothetical protein IT167_15530 [Bryobacterales bacterium]|nr:hypothetical protein [Bryobacterales bacterium]